MLEKIRKAMVESFVGAIAIGVLIANSIVNFVMGITTPLTEWLTMRLQNRQENPYYPSPEFPFQRLIPQWIASAVFLLIAYALLRWLYMEPSAAAPSDLPEEQGPEESA